MIVCNTKYQVNLIIWYQTFSMVTSYEETVGISYNIALEMIMLSYWSCFCFYIVNVITTINFVRDVVIMNTNMVDIVINIIIIITLVVFIVIVRFEIFQMLLNPEFSDWLPPLIHSKDRVLKTYLLTYIVSSQVSPAIAVRTCLSWVLLTFASNRYIAVLIVCFPVTFLSKSPEICIRYALFILLYLALNHIITYIFRVTALALTAAREATMGVGCLIS